MQLAASLQLSHLIRVVGGGRRGSWAAAGRGPDSQERPAGLGGPSPGSAWRRIFLVNDVIDGVGSQQDSF